MSTSITRGSWLAILLAAAAASARGLAWAPGLTLAGLAGTAWPWLRAWRAAEGTALRPALVWAAIALALAGLSSAVALTESVESGRPLAGQVGYLSTLAMFAALISVLNARTPGGGAWAILMALLLVVFLVPWLEGPGLVREAGGWDRLRLTAPWTIFYVLLVVAGVTNYLPTRFGLAAVWLGIGFAAEFLGLIRLGWSHEMRGRVWTAVPLCWGLAAWFADLAGIRPDPAPPGLGWLWAWFCDCWGVVWALRVQERFNRAAESAGWPVRLTWRGVVGEAPPEATATLIGLLRRFARTGRLEEISGSREDS
ncbi:MAG TPA: hypothetical protein VGH33_03195 [Isosphaeraceae bacterium]